jgi:hypothetical protein
VTVYRPGDGLYDDVIHQILEDDAGRLWMSSNRGIFWVNRADLNAFARGEQDQVRSTSYTERDGLRSREANGGMQPAGIKARDGRLWFATQDGVAVVDPATIRQNKVAPPVVIEHLVDDDSVWPATEDGHLAAGQRNFEIVYSPPSALCPPLTALRPPIPPHSHTPIPLLTAPSPADHVRKAVVQVRSDVRDTFPDVIDTCFSPRRPILGAARETGAGALKGSPAPGSLPGYAPVSNSRHPHARPRLRSADRP